MSITSLRLSLNHLCNATAGGNYDRDADAFYDNQPFSSWTLNTETYVWEAPTPQPTDGSSNWNEETQSWDAVE
jgi:hypothetical protein